MAVHVFAQVVAVYLFDVAREVEQRSFGFHIEHATDVAKAIVEVDDDDRCLALLRESDCKICGDG